MKAESVTNKQEIDFQLQKREFLALEGNEWFARNRAALAAASPVRDLIVSRIAAQFSAGARARVLEIGCGDGSNLAALAACLPIEGHGIDPSSAAIASGSVRYPALALQTGTADILPFEDSAFDLVWFGFCLYLVDRCLLMRAVAEADRVLRPGGVLAIIDFDPDSPCVRNYHHRSGLNTYKMDYSRLFLSNPAYVLAEKRSTNHRASGWESDPQERVALTICRKDAENAYRRI